MTHNLYNLHAREVRERLRGRVDPEVLLVLEALAEVDEKTGVFVAKSTHDNWMAKGKSANKQDIYKEYRRGVTRARKSGKRAERQSINRRAIEDGDLRLQWKIHMQKYGDEYADDTEAVEVSDPPFAVPEELIEEWQQQIPSPE